MSQHLGIGDGGGMGRAMDRVGLTDSSRAEDTYFALLHEITGSVARHIAVALLACWLAGCWLAGCWLARLASWRTEEGRVRGGAGLFTRASDGPTRRGKEMSVSEAGLVEAEFGIRKQKKSGADRG